MELRAPRSDPAVAESCGTGDRDGKMKELCYLRQLN